MPACRPASPDAQPLTAPPLTAPPLRQARDEARTASAARVRAERLAKKYQQAAARLRQAAEADAARVERRGAVEAERLAAAKAVAERAAEEERRERLALQQERSLSWTPKTGPCRPS